MSILNIDKRSVPKINRNGRINTSTGTTASSISSAGATHAHDNKDVLDAITAGLVVDWTTAFTNSHAHTNKATIDGITPALVTDWNEAHTKTAPITIAADIITIDRSVHITGDITASGDVVAFVASAISSDIMAGLSATAPLRKSSNSNMVIDLDAAQFQIIGGALQIKPDVISAASHKHNQLYNPAGTVAPVYVDASNQIHLDGNIIQSGAAYETHAEQVLTKDDLIILRDGAASGLANGAYAGFIAKKYDGVNDGYLVFDNNGVARVGDIGQEQPLTTRVETPLSNGFAFWDAANYRLNFKALTAGDIPALSYLPLIGGDLTGALTGTLATFSAGINSKTYLAVTKDGSDLISVGAYLVLTNTTNSNQHLMQLNSTSGLMFQNYNVTRGGWLKTFELSKDGAGTFASGVIAPNFYGAFNGVATSSYISNTLAVPDVRDAITTPNTYTTPQVKFEFKSNAAAGLSDGGGFVGLMTLRKYGGTSDWTGGRANQLAFTDANNLWIRVGDNNTWESWQKFYHSGNFNKSDVAFNASTGTFSGNIQSANLGSTYLYMPNANNWSYIQNNATSGGLKLGTNNTYGVYTDNISMSSGGNFITLHQPTTVPSLKIGGTVNSDVAQDASGLYIEQTGNNTANGAIRLQASKSGDHTNYIQFFVDPINGFNFKSIGTGNASATFSAGISCKHLGVSEFSSVGAGVASSSIFLGGDGIAHSNICWQPNERTISFHTSLTGNAVDDYWGVVNLYAGGNISAGGNFSAVGIVAAGGATLTGHLRLNINDAAVNASNYKAIEFAEFGNVNARISQPRDGAGMLRIDLLNNSAFGIYTGSNSAMYMNYLGAVTFTSVVTAAGGGFTGKLNGETHTNGSDGWWRSNGNCGWYNESYGTGIYSIQAGEVRTYNNANFYCGTNITAGGEITAYSDRRLKSNIKPLKLRGELLPVTYIKDGKESIGFIAQDVQLLYPELVRGEGDEMLSLNYGQLTAVLYAEIIEMKRQINELRKGLINE